MSEGVSNTMSGSIELLTKTCFLRLIKKEENSSGKLIFFTNRQGKVKIFELWSIIADDISQSSKD